MTIKNTIEIDSVYTRSINLERDIESSAIVKSYIPTSRSLLTLRSIAKTFGAKDVPRSWALIGPYGSGKSSFAVYLANILDNPRYGSTKSAMEVCSVADTSLSGEYCIHTKDSKGYLPVLLTGTPEPLGHRFITSLQQAAQNFWQTIPGCSPAIVNKLAEVVSRKDVATHEILNLVEEVRIAVEAINGKGLLIIFDELGKFLEYEARHYGANDIYLLQALAEKAAKGRKANIYIFTIMHQGFEQYARGLGEDLRNEWSKVQGRFENIPFLESTEQTLRIISKAFVQDMSSSDQRRLTNACVLIARTLNKENALPGNLDKETAAQLFGCCYPLHPVTALILPILCQKMAQNERTLFSYIGSKEQHGLKDSLERLKNVDDWIMPHEIFDYFILNQSAVLTDPTTHRRWAEVVIAIERLGDAPAKQIELLKTIGLLNIIGAQGGLKASKAIVHLCASSKKAATMTVNSLIDSSVLKFRKFSSEYRVWQGSDFDLDVAVRDEIGQIGHFDLADAINKRKPLQAIVARKHTIETGALRYFKPYFADLVSIQNQPENEEEQRITFCLVESESELQNIQKAIVSKVAESKNLIAFCHNAPQLREAVGEVLALHRVEQNCPELQTDPIAQKEFKDRLAIAERQEDELLHGFFEHPERAEWFWQGRRVTISDKRALQQKLSMLLDAIYSLSPRIHNELINREKPSAQASAARNKLVAAMVHHVDEADLGIEKFPAEKGVYRAFLHATGLHQKSQNGKWELVPPTQDNEFNFYPVWKEIDAFLESTTNTPRSFAELNKTLRLPPYGIKKGVLPLLYLTVFLCYQEDLALYENKVYTPYITDQHIERFMKRPDYFTVQRVRMEGIRASLFQQYIKVLYGEGSKQKNSLLAIAKPLSQFIAGLPEYTKYTNRISDASQKARKAFELASSPMDLLFDRLPKACGYSAINPNETDVGKIDGFAVALVGIIRELRDAYSVMIADFEKLISQALLPDIKGTIKLQLLRRKVSSRYEDLRKYTVDTKGVRPFIEFLSNDNGDDELWLNRILLFLGGRASDKWTDVERDGAVKKLEELSRRLIDLRILQDHHAKAKSHFGEGFEVIWLRSMRHGKTDCAEIVKISEATQKYIKKNMAAFEKLLEGLDSDESRLALLAEVVDGFLAKKKERKKEEQIRNIEVMNE